METPREKICECHNQPITIKTMDNGFNIPEGDRTYFKFPDGQVVQFICKTTGEPCSVVVEAVGEPLIKRKLQLLLNKEKVTRRDIQKYLSEKGYIKVNDLGWVLQEKLGELVIKGVIKQLNGNYFLTQEGVNKFTITSIFRYLNGKVNTLDIQAISRTVESKRKDDKLMKKIFEGMEADE